MNTHCHLALFYWGFLNSNTVFYIVQLEPKQNSIYFTIYKSFCKKRSPVVNPEQTNRNWELYQDLSYDSRLYVYTCLLMHFKTKFIQFRHYIWMTLGKYLIHMLIWIKIEIFEKYWTIIVIFNTNKNMQQFDNLRNLHI